MIRLDDRETRIAVGEGEWTVGSRPECDVSIRHPTVSRNHARLLVSAAGVTLEDAGSRNGIRLDGARVTSVVLQPGRPVQIGGVPITLEEVSDSDLEAALVFPPDTGEGELAAVGTQHSTCSAGPVEDFATNHLPGLLTLLGDGADAGAVARAVGAALFDSLPCLDLVVRRGEGHDFSADRRPPDHDGSGTCLELPAGEADLIVTFPAAHMGAAYKPVVEIGARLIAVPSKAETHAGREPSSTAAAMPQPATVVPKVSKIYADAARVARGDVGVLILGESGTGKEILARFIHRSSTRSDRPFLGLNCAALPGDLLESELFGIEKGVATGVDQRAGRFEMADGGTLFLDEIGDMRADTQSKILRVLQSGEVYRLGSSAPRRVDVRIVAATNRDIRAMLADGSFRTDLYHRIATWVVDLPPLRFRRADIPNLAAHFLAAAAAKNGVSVGGISRAALDALQAFPWPGNIRQLENEMTRAALFLEAGELLDTGRLSEEILASPRHGGTDLASTLEQVEKDQIALALAATDNDVDAAAERLGLSRATLYRRIKALGL